MGGFLKESLAKRGLTLFWNLQALLWLARNVLEHPNQPWFLWSARPAGVHGRLAAPHCGLDQLGKPFRSGHKSNLTASSVAWQRYWGRVTGNDWYIYAVSRIQRSSASIVPPSLWLWAKDGISFLWLRWHYLDTLWPTNGVTSVRWQEIAFSWIFILAGDMCCKYMAPWVPARSSFWTPLATVTVVNFVCHL